MSRRIKGWWVSPAYELVDAGDACHPNVIYDLIPELRAKFHRDLLFDIPGAMVMVNIALALGWSRVAKFERQLTVNPGAGRDMKLVLKALGQEHLFGDLLIVHPISGQGYGPEHMFRIEDDEDALDAWTRRGRPHHLIPEEP